MCLLSVREQERRGGGGGGALESARLRSVFLEVLANRTHSPEVKEQLCSFLPFKSLRSQKQSQSQPPEAPRARTAQSEPAGSRDGGKAAPSPKLSLQGHLQWRAEKRGTGQTRSSSPSAHIPEWEQASLHMQNYQLRSQGHSQADRAAQALQGRRNWRLGPWPWRSSLSGWRATPLPREAFKGSVWEQ